MPTGLGLRPGAKAPDEPPNPTGYAPPLDSTCPKPRFILEHYAEKIGLDEAVVREALAQGGRARVVERAARDDSPWWKELLGLPEFALPARNPGFVPIFTDDMTLLFGDET